MITILIVDDEKLERNGIKFLLKREDEEFHILEAVNGRDALGILQSKKVDLLFSDIKMPYVTGLDLAKQARELQPDIEIVIFSGYNDFSYAKEALHYGVVDYVLKPVDPGEFHRTFQKVRRNIEEKAKERAQQSRQVDYLKKYFLLDYLCYGKEESLVQAESLLRQGEEDDLGAYACMIMVGSSEPFFEVEEEKFLAQLREGIQRRFLYLNINTNESLFFFREKFSNYGAVAQQLYQFLRQKYDANCYLAVSREIRDYHELPQMFQELEELLAEQFYEPKQHVFFGGAAGEEEERLDDLEVSQVLDSISSDIHYKDIIHLRQDFQKLENKYKHEKQFSEMYVKFVFSSILKEVYEVMADTDLKMLEKQVDKLYRCRKIQEVIAITDSAISELERSVQEQNEGFREEITKVKSYICHHYDENLSIEMLAGRVYLSPGYLSVVFKEETGVNLNRFIREVRMNKAKELLETTNMKISQIARKVGISNNSYFCRSFREYFGNTPESCRKGAVNDSEAVS